MIDVCLLRCACALPTVPLEVQIEQLSQAHVKCDYIMGQAFSVRMLRYNLPFILKPRPACCGSEGHSTKRNMAISGLEALPNELLMAIFNLVDFTSLVHLNSMNRRLNQLTAGCLYSSFNGNEYAKFLHAITSPRLRGSSILVDYVRAATCRIRSSRYLFEGITEDERDVISTAFSQLALPNKESKDELICNYDMHTDLIQYDWYTDFFLLFLPRLEKLVVIQEESRWDLYLYWFEHLAANASNFSNLRCVTIHGPLTLKNILPLLALPSLKDLELHKCIDNQTRKKKIGFKWDHGNDNILPSILSQIGPGSNVEKLVLKEANFNTRDLTPILTSIKGLKEFYFEHKKHGGWQYFSPNIELLTTLLEKHAPTLTSLFCRHDIQDFTCDHQLPLISRDLFAPAKQLAHAPTFPHLRSLDIAIHFDYYRRYKIVDDEEGEYKQEEDFANRLLLHLPKGLEALGLTICPFANLGEFCHLEKAVYWFLLCLARQGEWEGTGLKEILVRTRFDSETDLVVKGWRELAEETFANAGVRCEIRGFHEGFEWETE